MDEITFNSMDDDRWYDQDYVLLLIENTVHEATYERSRGWFYLFNHWNFEGKDGLDEHIMLDDERLKGWAFCEIWRNHD